ncbi:MAG: hypothetical protein U9Q03_01375 [Patescibacteria group bacterium]|nr:hypothetical protein [Patescibacteria group bacterium]
MMDSENGVPGSKVWLDRAEILIADGIDERFARRYAQAQLDALPPGKEGVESLPVTSAEWADIVLLIDAASVLREYFGLYPLEVLADRVHLLRVVEYRTHFGMIKSCTCGGHVYLPEHVRFSPGQWLPYLSHEIAHLAGFVAATVVMESEDAARLSYTRFGLQRLGEGGGLEFIGLNEAVVEIASLNIRKIAAMISPPFGERYSLDDAAPVGYSGQMTMVNELCAVLAGLESTEWKDPREVIEVLLADFLGGSDVLLEKLAEIAPSILEIYRKMKG